MGVPWSYAAFVKCRNGFYVWKEWVPLLGTIISEQREAQIAKLRSYRATRGNVKNSSQRTDGEGCFWKQHLLKSYPFWLLGNLRGPSELKVQKGKKYLNNDHVCSLNGFKTNQFIIVYRHFRSSDVQQTERTVLVIKLLFILTLNIRQLIKIQIVRR
jgi:hypothetical protein